jgi:glycosyltransferase involved in cell wall biosynthesis
MNLLILSFYYEPDLSAGSFRTTALVRALRERAPPGTFIDVVTTLPNRYSTFTKEAAEVETHDGVAIRRIGLPPHRSDIYGQSRAFLRFARQALRHTAERTYDVVFATSSRLMTATLGAWIARRKKALLYLDIRDIFVDTIAELVHPAVAWPLQRILPLVEAWTMRRADRINLVSPGFVDYFRERYAGVTLERFTNGIDDEFLTFETHAAPIANGRAVVLYAGNIGQGQGLHEVLPGLARALRDRARFIVIGDGGRRDALAAAVAGLDNVELRAPMSRPDLLQAYRAANVLFLHLGDYPAFLKVLPSKVFEYAALGKPVLAGVGGYAARFIREQITNAAVFPPCQVGAAAAAFDSLDLVDRPRPDFNAKYARTKIVREMADDILSLREARR